MFSRSSTNGSEKSRPALTVHSKVAVAVDPPATSPVGTVRVVRPPASGAESANEPTSAAPTESARESSLAAMPPRGLSRRTVLSLSVRLGGRGSVTITWVHSEPAAVFDAVTV